MDINPNALVLLEILGENDSVTKDNCSELIGLALANDREELYFIKEAIADFCLKYFENIPEYLNQYLTYSQNAVFYTLSTLNTLSTYVFFNRISLHIAYVLRVLSETILTKEFIR